MEYLEGQPLNRILRQVLLTGGITLAAQLRILADALTGLHYAHELRDFDGTPLEVVHRDVSPQNVFVTYDGQVKVVDFGVAKAAMRSSDASGGMINGKIAYMAPEQALGEAIDRRADLFSMGVMLWEIAARRRMWKGRNVPQILRELVAGRIPQLAADRARNSPELSGDLRACHGHDAGRCASRALPNFATELELLLEQLEPKSGHDVGAQVRAAFRRGTRSSSVADRGSTRPSAARDGVDARPGSTTSCPDWTIPSRRRASRRHPVGPAPESGPSIDNHRSERRLTAFS